MKKGGREQKPLDEKILDLLRRWGRGCVFSNSDFFAYAPGASVGRSLHELKEKGKIRPLLRGLYDYPKYSTLLQEELAPDLNRVAQALARKHKWHIQTTGSTALNYLGLSTQIPMRVTFLSDGPSRKFTIDGRILEFKHTSIKESYLGDEECELFIQAIKELGDLALSDDYNGKIRAILTPKLRAQVDKALPLLTEKVRNIIRTLLQ